MVSPGILPVSEMICINETRGIAAQIDMVSGSLLGFPEMPEICRYALGCSATHALLAI